MKRITVLLLLLTSWMIHSMEPEEAQVLKTETSVQRAIEGKDEELLGFPRFIQENLAQYLLCDLNRYIKTLPLKCKSFKANWGCMLNDINSLQFSPDEDKILKASNTTNMLDVKTGAKTGYCFGTVRGNICLLWALFNPAGDKVAVWSRDEIVEIWDLKAPNKFHTNDHCARTLDHRPLAPHEHGIISLVKFDSTGEKIVTGTMLDYTVEIWNVETGDCLATFQDTGRISSIAFDPTDQKVIIASEGGVTIVDALTGEFIRGLAGHTNTVRSALFNSAGDKVVTASDDGTAKIWNALTGKCIFTLRDHTDSVTTAIFNPAGNKVATASDDGTVKVWEVDTGKLLYTLPVYHTLPADHIPRSSKQFVEFNATGDKILTVSMPNSRIQKVDSANLWDAATGKLLYAFKRDKKAVRAAAFNPAGDKVVLAFVDSVVMYDLSQLLIPELLAKVATVQQAAILIAIFKVMKERHDIWRRNNQTFDFNDVPHLWAAYASLPETLRMFFDPYIIKPSSNAKK